MTSNAAPNSTILAAFTVMRPNAAVQPRIRAQREFVGWNCLLYVASLDWLIELHSTTDQKKGHETEQKNDNERECETPNGIQAEMRLDPKEIDGETGKERHDQAYPELGSYSRCGLGRVLRCGYGGAE